MITLAKIQKALSMPEGPQREAYVAKICPNLRAKEVIGYFSGYFDPKTARQILDLFKTTHPFFGPSWPETPISPEKAFKMGLKLGKKIALQQKEPE